jgi:hypothetical protein
VPDCVLGSKTEAAVRACQTVELSLARSRRSMDIS